MRMLHCDVTDVFISFHFFSFDHFTPIPDLSTEDTFDNLLLFAPLCSFDLILLISSVSGGMVFCRHFI